MHVVVTGAGSFIGRALLRLCDAQGVQVTGIDLISLNRSDCVVGDIRSDSVADLIPENVDAIVHLAALSRDPDCRGKAMDCFDSNVMATLRLMDIAAAKQCKQFIFTSSEWVYSHFPEGEDVTEETLIDISRHTSEYALSKLVSEANLRQRHAQGFCHSTIVRLGIVYGPRASNWCAVESLMMQVYEKEQIQVGSAATGRRFIHVDDVARGILSTVGQEGFEIFNLQGSTMVTLRDVVETSGKLFGKSVEILESAPDNVSIRTVSGQKAKERLGFEPSISIHEGLESVAKFLGLLE